MLLRLLMVVFITSLAISSVGCISVNLNIPPEKVMVYERYPEYKIAPQPVLTDLTGHEVTPFIKAVDFAKNASIDGTWTDKEQKQFQALVDDGVKIRARAVDKQLDNANDLITWGKKNQSTLELYNAYAADKNKRIADQ